MLACYWCGDAVASSVAHDDGAATCRCARSLWTRENPSLRRLIVSTPPKNGFRSPFLSITMDVRPSGDMSLVGVRIRRKDAFVQVPVGRTTVLRMDWKRAHVHAVLHRVLGS